MLTSTFSHSSDITMVRVGVLYVYCISRSGNKIKLNDVRSAYLAGQKNSTNKLDLDCYTFYQKQNIVMR